jgi:hypothetical protein
MQSSSSSHCLYRTRIDRLARSTFGPVRRGQAHCRRWRAADGRLSVADATGLIGVGAEVDREPRQVTCSIERGLALSHRRRSLSGGGRFKKSWRLWAADFRVPQRIYVPTDCPSFLCPSFGIFNN